MKEFNPKCKNRWFNGLCKIASKKVGEDALCCPETHQALKDLKKEEKKCTKGRRCLICKTKLSEKTQKRAKLCDYCTIMPADECVESHMETISRMFNVLEKNITDKIIAAMLATVENHSHPHTHYTGKE